MDLLAGHRGRRPCRIPSAASVWRVNGLTAGPLVLGRYRLLSRLGVGASATVWHAWDAHRRREVALKLLHPHLADESAALARLETEARSVRRLRHPGVVRLLEAHLGKGQPALAFEHLPGETLGQRLARDGALPPAEGAAIGAAVADALAHAHARGLIHRDVKPSNVLLGTDGSVRLLDFGICGLAGVGRLTDAGMAVGTLPYMAAEQLAGRPPQPASDVYSLAAVMYQALAGRVPFPATNAIALVESQQAPPPPLAGPGARVNPILAAALAPDASRRPTAAEMAVGLRALASPAADAPTTVVAVTAPPGGHRSRNGFAVGAGVTAATLLLAVVFGASNLVLPIGSPAAGGVASLEPPGIEGAAGGAANPEDLASPAEPPAVSQPRGAVAGPGGPPAEPRLQGPDDGKPKADKLKKSKGDEKAKDKKDKPKKGDKPKKSKRDKKH